VTDLIPVFAAAGSITAIVKKRKQIRLSLSGLFYYFVMASVAYAGSRPIVNNEKGCDG
jgi:hypothetical protein